LLDTVTFVAEGALPLNVIVQVEPVGGVTLVGLHVRLVRVGVTGWLIVMVVPPPLIGMLFPLPSDADALLLIPEEVFNVEDEI
jgi:hypothetical protein